MLDITNLSAREHRFLVKIFQLTNVLIKQIIAEYRPNELYLT